MRRCTECQRKVTASERKTLRISLVHKIHVMHFKPGLIAFLMSLLKFAFEVLSKVSAYAPSKRPGDYGKERLFYQ